MPKVKKNKMKSHKGTQKVLNVKGNGKTVTAGHPGTRHNTGKKNAASNRKGRTQTVVSKADMNRLKKVCF